MKKYAIAIIIVCCHLSVSANIINGFILEKLKLEIEIQNLVKLSEEAESNKLSIKLERKLNRLRKEYFKVSQSYSETAQLILEFERIDPILFDRVSKVTNSEGTLTHVYVKYVNHDSKEFNYYNEFHYEAFGYTLVGQWDQHENYCTSNYGTNTISVTIVNGCDKRIVLAHEFGHVLYVVPNLKSYFKFMHYNRYKNNKYNKGHGPFDPSNKFVQQIEDSFREKYNSFLASEKISNVEVEML